MPDSAQPTPAIVTVPADALITSLRRDLAAATLALSEARAGLDTLHAALTRTRGELAGAQRELVEYLAAESARSGPQDARTAAIPLGSADDSAAVPSSALQPQEEPEP